jgi:ADP-ribosyl-[dinitrogen reductase] hydrolase
MIKSKDRVLGALLGVAAGDALGTPLEFMSAEEIRAKHGGEVRDMIGGGWLNVAPGEITDDTQMTLAVAEGIVESPDNPAAAIGRRFIEWYDSDPKDIGNCCRAVIAYAKAVGANDLDSWVKAAKHVHFETGKQTAGNGALMRTIYPALWYGEKGHHAATVISRMTHWHSHSALAVKSYVLAVADAINDVSGGDEIGWRKGCIEQRMENFRELIDERELRPDGYVINSLVCAINSIRDTDTFEDALVRTVNLGGDADTIGAITGGLAGARYGAKAIPERWTDALDKGIVKRIEQLAERAASNA